MSHLEPLPSRTSWLGSAWRRAIRLARETFSVRPAPRYARPTLEALEDRIAPTVNITYHGGPIIPHVEVNNINMGRQPVNTTALMQALVKDYLPLLGPNYGIGAGTLRSATTASPFASNPTDAQIRNFLLQEINSGAVPPPNGNQVYVVFLSPGQKVSDIVAEAGGSVSGYHASFPVIANGSGFQVPPSLVPIGTQFHPIYYAVVFGNGAQEIQITASHELAEAVTDPAPGPSSFGFIDPNLFPVNGGEVADIFEFAPPFSVDGFLAAVLSDPQGQKIEHLPPMPPATPQNLVILAIQEVQSLAFHYFATLNPQFVYYSQMADGVLSANPLYGTPQGQIGVLLGEVVFANWLAQQNGG